MIHKQFEYRRKLFWAAIFLVISLSTTSSMIWKEQAFQTANKENVSTLDLRVQVPMLPFLKEDIIESSAW